jgi:hypothetical protein
MMNRGVMDRQMFAKGGAAFPDLSGDGKVTQKDILMGRGVIPMQEGGMAPMMPPQGAAPMMPPSAAMMGEASGVPEEQAEAMGAQVMDTGAMQGMLAQVADNLENLDEVEDYEQVMNVMRGDNATLEDRYNELSSVVGPEDARQTPESVLALVQPVMMMAAVDQGIGGLAAEEMTAPVEGPMAGGIMSTVAPPPPQEAPPMPPAGMGGPPPVNFKKGGLVRRGDNQPVKYFSSGGVDFEALMPYIGPRVGSSPEEQVALRAQVDAAMAPPSTVADLYNINVPTLEDAFSSRQASYRKLLGEATSPEEIERQKKMTQAQMLFDIAQTALTFAGPMQGERRGMSPAERLALAASSTKLPQTIGARAQQQIEFEKDAKKESRAVDVAALTAAEAEVTAAEKAERDVKIALAKKEDDDKATKPFTTTRAITIDDKQYAPNVLVNLQPSQVSQVDPDALKPYEKPGEGSAFKAYEVTSPIVFKGVDVAKGEVLNITSEQASSIENFETSTIPYKAADKALAAKPIEVRDKGGNIVKRLDLSLPKDRLAFSQLGTDVTTHTIGTYNKDAPKSAVWKEIRDTATGELLSIVDTNTEGGAAAVANAPSEGKAAYNIGTYSEDKPEDISTKLVVSTKPVTVRGSNIQPGTPMYLTNDEINAIKTESGADALRNYEKPDKPPAVFGSGSADKALQYFATGMVGDQRALDAYAAGAQDDIMESMISNYTAPVVDARGVMQKRQLPDFVKQVIKQRLLANPNMTSPVPLNTLGLTTQEMQTIRPTQDLPLLNPDNTVNLERATSDPTFIITGLDYTLSQGFASSLNRVFNVFAGQAAELGLGPGYAGNTGKITSASDKQLNALARQTISVARNAVDGRVFALDLELLRDEVNGFTPSGVRTDLGALQQLRVVRQTLASQYSRAKNIVDSAAADPGAFDAKTVQTAKLAMMDTERLIAEYTAAILAYEANVPGRGAATTVTSTLPRVN